MAEETVRLPDTPDVNRSWRRVSTGKLSFLYSEEKLLPNYLRSPTGSCHDVCKYGRKHESEDKPRVSPLKRVNRSFSGALSFDSPLRKKALTKSVLNPSFGFEEYYSVGGSGHAKSEVRDLFRRVCDVKKQNAERPEKKAVSLSDSTKRKKKTVSQSLKMIGVSRGRALEMVEHNNRVTALKLKSVAQTAAKALRSSTLNKEKINGGSKATEPKRAVVPLRAPMSSKRYSKSLKTKKESNGFSVPVITTQNIVDEKCKDLVEEKTLYVIKMKTGNEIVESDQNHRCVVDSPSDDPSSSQLKSQDKAEDFVTEGPETEDDNEFSKEEEEEHEYDHDHDHDDNAFFSEDKNTTGKGKSRALSTKSAVDGKSVKLGFKRGKVVDFGSEENSLRKLKYKRGKLVTGADTTSNSGCRRNLKSKGTTFSDDEEQLKPKSLKDVLKHQDTQIKKDHSRVLLFNNVIEETANKLVETRKSKVKALVGAFESVISLQEKISSATT